MQRQRQAFVRVLLPQAKESLGHKKLEDGETKALQDWYLIVLNPLSTINMDKHFKTLSWDSQTLRNCRLRTI